MSYKIEATRKGHRILSLLIRNFPKDSAIQSLLTDEFDIWYGELTDKDPNSFTPDALYSGAQVVFDNKTEHFYVQLDEDKDEIYHLRWVGWRALKKKKEPGGYIGLTNTEYLEPEFNRKELVFKQSWVDDSHPTNKH